jgi:hypothetical protein
MRYSERPTNGLIKPAKYFAMRFVLLVLFRHLRRSTRPMGGLKLWVQVLNDFSFIVMKKVTFIYLICVDIFKCNIFRFAESGTRATVGRSSMSYIFRLFCPSLITKEVDIATSVENVPVSFSVRCSTEDPASQDRSPTARCLNQK